MLQNIQPHKFNNNFKQIFPKNTDYLLVFNGENLLMDASSGKLAFTTVQQINDLNSNVTDNTVYLFSIDNSSIFCSLNSIEESENLKYMNTMNLREIIPKWMAFIAATANHLAYWYDTNKFCGKCGKLMNFSKTERALCCENCGLTRYPNINPAIIVGIINNDKILLTRYADRPYKKLSLVAGFMEIGETLEDTIKREVMEEVGLKIKNLRYFKSQPWAFSQSVLMGFFAELDGDSDIKLDKTELSEATWYSREEITECETTLSLTNEMIETFRKNKIENFLSLV